MVYSVEISANGESSCAQAAAKPTSAEFAAFKTQFISMTDTDAADFHWGGLMNTSCASMGYDTKVWAHGDVTEYIDGTSSA